MRKVDHARKKGRVGSSFDEFLQSDGLYAEVAATAIARVALRQADAQKDCEGHSEAPVSAPSPLAGEGK
jgi:hypothetical protein